MNINDLLLQFLALGGVASLVTVIVNLLKSFSVIHEGQAETWVTALNLIGFVAFFALKIIGFTNFPQLDQTASAIAQILVLIFQLFSQFGFSKVAHAAIRGTPFVGFSYSLRRERAALK